MRRRGDADSHSQTAHRHSRTRYSHGHSTYGDAYPHPIHTNSGPADSYAQAWDNTSSGSCYSYSRSANRHSCSSYPYTQAQG